MTMTMTQIGAAPDADVRTFVAREVHDRIGSGLALVLRRLDLLEHAPPGRPDLRRSRLDEARSALAEALGATRALVADLRGAPSGGGAAAAPVPSLEAALRGYLRAAAPTGTAVRLRVRGDEGRLPGPVRDEVAVVVREALRNALAHARAASVGAVVTVTPVVV
ncbi:sensor histidine kinase, partial [Kitasatospora sp. NPDC057198]|uniref:sensor histidine kinase n=1 Tax=Kitasatospora sp. NPDC057198 TaxID=3346046 RepID=UPI003637703E